MARKKKTRFGFDNTEKDEAREAEEMKSRSASSDSSDLSDGKTYDHETGNYEGKIILGSEGATGLLVPLEIVEKVEASYEHNGEEPKDEGRDVSGYFKLSNPSSANKIWDVDVSFKESGKIEWAKKEVQDDALHIRTFGADEEKVLEYKIKEFEVPALKVTEFISALNDEETESYALSSAGNNVILFKLTVQNTTDYDLTDVVVKKALETDYDDIDVTYTSEGETDVESEGVTWTIANLGANEEAVIKINASVAADSGKDKINSGPITADYKAEHSFSGLEIDKFDAYSDNFVGIDQYQQDDDPDKYTSQVIFENQSEFQVQLVNLDVVEEASGNKVLDIDPKDIPPLAAGARWESTEWEVETENAEEPQYLKIVEFFLLSEHMISSEGSISIDDVELAVALMAGALQYSASKIASFRVVPFDALLQVKNTGAADLNDLVMEEVIQMGFVPPKPEEVELYVIRPDDEDDDVSSTAELENVDWEALGDPISIDESMIEITPNDQEADSEHTLKINLTDLRSSSIGMFLPGMVVRAKYPLQAHKIAKDVEYVSNVVYTANTYPAGVPMEIIPEEIRIPVLHERKRFSTGKTVHALPADGEYEITILVKNRGDHVLEKVTARDLVDRNTFEYSDFSVEPTEYDSLEGKDKLVWIIDKIEPEESVEITYKITGQGDYRASESQKSL